MEYCCLKMEIRKNERKQRKMQKEKKRKKARNILRKLPVVFSLCHWMLITALRAQTSEEKSCFNLHSYMTYFLHL